MITTTNAPPERPIPAADERRSPLHNRTFALVLAGAFVSNVGNWMENSAQNWAVVSQLRGDATRQAFMSEILNVADFAPALLLVLFAGVMTDRVDAKRYLLTLQLLACGLGAGLAVAAFAGWASPWVVIAFTFAEGVVWALNGPPWQAVVPGLVPRAQLPEAVALNSAQFNLARLIGPFLAGLIIAHFGIAAAFTVNAASFVLVIYALLRMPRRPRTATATAPATVAEAERSLWRDLTTGLRIAFRHPGLRRLSIMLGLFMFLAAPLQGLLAVYVQQVLRGESRLYGILLGAIGLGAFCGALTIGRIPSYYPRHHLIPVGMCLTCVFMLVFTFAHSAAVAFPILVAVGYFWMISLNSTNAANQLLATEQNRGRVLSVMLLFTQGATPLGHLAAAGMTHLMSPPHVIRAMVGALLVVCVGFLAWREPAIDEMPPQPAQPESFLGALWEGLTAQSHRPVPQALRTEIAGESAAAADANPRSL